MTEPDALPQQKMHEVEELARRGTREMCGVLQSSALQIEVVRWL
jgi:hypothetical protein